jgi:hypothetical protein
MVTMLIVGAAGLVAISSILALAGEARRIRAALEELLYYRRIEMHRQGVPPPRKPSLLEQLTAPVKLKK